MIRLLRGAVVASVLMMGAVALSAPSPSSAAVHPSKADACENSWVRTSVSALHTSANGTGIALAETNVSPHFCYLVSPLVVQFLTASGVKVLPAVTSPSFVGNGGLATTYEATFAVSVKPASHCARQPMAAAIRVTAGGATWVTHAAGLLRICASGTQPVTVSPVAFPNPGPCRGSVVLDQIGWGNGAAGTTYFGLRFENTGTTSCTLHGVPTIQPIASDGSTVGPPAGIQSLANHGTPMVLGVHNGVSAWSELGVTDTGNYTPSICGSENVWGIRLTLPGYAPRDLPFKISVCTKLSSTNVSGVAPPWITF